MTEQPWWKDEWDTIFLFLLAVAVMIYMVVAKVNPSAMIALTAAVAAVFADQAISYYQMSRMFGLKAVASVWVPGVFSAIGTVAYLLVAWIVGGPSEFLFYLGLLGGIIALLSGKRWLVTRFNMLTYSWSQRRAKGRGTKASVEVTDQGVCGRDDEGQDFEIRWEDLVEVGVLTTSDGPFSEDFFFILLDNEGIYGVVPHGESTELLPWLQRLEGFDNAMLIEALGCSWDDRFILWTKEAGEAEVTGD